MLGWRRGQEACDHCLQLGALRLHGIKQPRYGIEVLVQRIVPLVPMRARVRVRVWCVVCGKARSDKGVTKGCVGGCRQRGGGNHPNHLLE